MSHLRALGFTALVALGDLATPALAGNGLNLLATGFEATMMGSAEFAVTADPFALASNPAGLARVKGWQLEQHAGIARATDFAHKDSLNASTPISNQYAFQGNLGLGYGMRDRPLAFGLAAFAAGGAGAVYERLETPFGQDDELSSTFALSRLAAGVAWRVD